MNVPDRGIEAAAEALRDNWPSPYAPQRLARVAIEAAMPAIREAIAQEIEASQDLQWAAGPEYYQGSDDAARIVRGGTR